MYTPHTVTVYNAVENVDTLKTEMVITVLEGVFLDISEGANIMRSGLTSADAAKLYIPFSTKAVNGVTEEVQRYLPPKEYERTEDKTPFWTIRTNGTASAKDCFFVKGAVVEPDADFQTINGRYDHVYRVSTVDIRDFGSPEMQHWEVGGR